MAPRPIKRVCIQWPRFGPYHLARLRAVHAHLAPRGIELIGLETAGSDTTYAWQQEQDEMPFRREQVFPHAAFERLPPAEVHRGVTAALERLQPDALAINSYSLPDARACLAWGRRHQRVTVVMTDSKADDAPRIAWREYLKSLLISQFDAALLAGTPQREYFLDLGFPDSHIFLGYDVVDNAFFQTGADEARAHPGAYRHLPGLGDETPFFLASNRFIPRKNLQRLLHAYATYRSRADHPWRLVLLGDGPERAHLERLLDEQNIEGVTLAGFRQITELPAYYGLASAFVHPALADQWGLVVNEAMAAGLPVLVSESTGCARDLVAIGENGYRFSAEDTKQLADLMMQVSALETDLREMGRRSQEIIADWSPTRFAEALWQAIETGRPRTSRRFDPRVRLFLDLLRRVARSSDSFHTVDA